MRSLRPRSNIFRKLLILSACTGIAGACGPVVIYLYNNPGVLTGKFAYKDKYDIRHSSNDLVPIISYINEANSRKLDLDYSVPDYSNNQELYDYLISRTISIRAVKRSDQGDYYTQESTSGTGFILGPASGNTRGSGEQGKSQSGVNSGNEHWYYLASNMHVLRNFFSPDFVQGFYGFSPYLIEKAKTDDVPTHQEISTNLNNLTVNFSSSSNSSSMNYYKMVVDTSFSYFADKVEFKKRPTLLSSSRSVQPFNSHFHADFGVIRVNLSPETNQSNYKFEVKPPSTSNTPGSSSPAPSTSPAPTSRSTSSNPNDPITSTSVSTNPDYLTKLKDTINKHGDVVFSPDNVDNGYMLSYPTVDEGDLFTNKSPYSLLNDLPDRRSVAVNLKVNNLKDKTVKMGSKGYSDPTYYQPTIDYSIPGLNLLPGSSGTPLIYYQPNKNDLNKFTYAGVYWGVLLDQGGHKNQIYGSRGMITKVKQLQDYDLISANTKNNSLCSAILRSQSTSYTVNKGSGSSSTPAPEGGGSSSSNTKNIGSYTPDYCK